MAKNKRKITYLKLGHLVLNHLLRSNNWNAAIFYTIADLIMVSSPIKALIRAIEVCLLQAMIIEKIIVRTKKRKRTID
jgi:hypothetical protein